MNIPLTTQTLSAYIDGELDPEQMKAVEEALEEDRLAREELERLIALNDLMTEAYDVALKSPVPLRTAKPLQRNEDSEPAGAAANSMIARKRLHTRYIGAIAASLLIAVLAFPAGFLMSESRHETEMARFEAQIEADRSAMASAMSEALEKRLSGVPVEWRNPKTGSAGSVTPIRTFQNRDGSWCREYREVSTISGRNETRHAIACRSNAGEWRNKLLAVGDS